MCFDAQLPLVHIKLQRADHCREKPPLAAPRPDVLAWPSPTISRYLVFVTALLSSGLFVGGWLFGGLLGGGFLGSWFVVVTATGGEDQ